MYYYHYYHAMAKAKNDRAEITTNGTRKKLESAKRFIEGLEEECKYFAKELHDGIANDLLALQMKTEMEGHKELAASVGNLRKNVRTISHKLMPPVFDHIGLNQLLKQWHIACPKVSIYQ